MSRSFCVMLLTMAGSRRRSGAWYATLDRMIDSHKTMRQRIVGNAAAVE